MMLDQDGTVHEEVLTCGKNRFSVLTIDWENLQQQEAQQ